MDAGCGTGQYAKVLKDLGVGKITILDASQELLDFAKEKLRINDVATLAKLPDLPFKDGTFDAAMFNMVGNLITLGTPRQPTRQRTINATEINKLSR